MPTWKKYSVDELVKEEVLHKPLDGNHGEIHPKGNDFVKDGIPFIMASDINRGRINFKTCKKISSIQAASLRKGFAIEGDVLLSHKGTIGKTAIVPVLDSKYIVLTPQVTYYRIKNEDILSSEFLKYYFNSKQFQDVFNSRAGSGSTRAYIGITDQLKLPIILPPLPTQHRIAEILGALDDKIELNLQMNKTLEEMAMALYKHWFVDFGPFKDGEFVDSELGKIPKGWEVKKLKEVATITMGQSPSSKYYNQDQKGFPFHQGVKDYGERFPTDIIYSTDGNRIAEENDILFSVRAPVGKINIAKNKIILGRGLAGIKLSSYDNNFLYYSLRIQFKEIDSFGDGTVYKSVNKNDMENIKVIFPESKVLLNFNEIVNRYDRHISLNYYENTSLIKTRDYLLPKLISGEVEVKEAEKEIKDIA